MSKSHKTLEIAIGKAYLGQDPKAKVRTVLEVWFPAAIHDELRRVEQHYRVDRLRARVCYETPNGRRQWCDLSVFETWAHTEVDAVPR